MYPIRPTNPRNIETKIATNTIIAPICVIGRYAIIFALKQLYCHTVFTPLESRRSITAKQL
jgi:hypothetical protein